MSSIKKWKDELKVLRVGDIFEWEIHGIMPTKYRRIVTSFYQENDVGEKIREWSEVDISFINNNDYRLCVDTKGETEGDHKKYRMNKIETPNILREINGKLFFIWREER